MTHPAFTSNSVACITGGASGIGFAFAQRFAEIGMRLVLLDNRAEKLAEAQAALPSGVDVMVAEVDVADRAALETIEQDVVARFGGTDILINNAGIGRATSIFEPTENWQSMMAVNLWGPINGTQVFGPRMVARGRAGLIMNTGSKQGITTPPGNPGYNVTKAGVKAFTEALSHELRNTEGANLSAHLLIPGFVFSDMTRGSRTEKPDAAWTPEQTADFAIDRVNAGEFYILCPDNDVDRATDEKRMAWAIGDIIENRPALSRWHPDWSERFADYMSNS